MSTGTILVGIALVIITIPIVANPLLGRKGLPTLFGSSSSRSDNLRKQTALLALQDLDFDYKLGKIADADYQQVRARLIEQAADAIEEAKQLKDARLEQLINDRRTTHSQSASKTCSSCEEAVKDSDRFCPHCGTPLVASCTACGKEIVDGDTFCSSCGVALLERQAL